MKKLVCESLDEYSKIQEEIYEGWFDKKKTVSKETPAAVHDKPKEENYFDVFLNNLNNDQYGLPILFTVLDEGFAVNKRYGSPKTNYYSFDVRSDNKIMNLIHAKQSFLETTNYKGKEYMVVGLALDKTNKDVSEFSKKWITVGRDGYAFAAIEYTKDVVDYITKKTGQNDIKKILINEAIESAKHYFTAIKDWNGAIKKLNV